MSELQNRNQRQEVKLYPRVEHSFTQGEIADGASLQWNHRVNVGFPVHRVRVQVALAPDSAGAVNRAYPIITDMFDGNTQVGQVLTLNGLKSDVTFEFATPKYFPNTYSFWVNTNADSPTIRVAEGKVCVSTQLTFYEV